MLLYIVCNKIIYPSWFRGNLIIKARVFINLETKALMQQKFSAFQKQVRIYHRFEHELSLGKVLWHSVLFVFCLHISSAGYPSPSNLVRYSTLGDATELQITKDLLVRELIRK